MAIAFDASTQGTAGSSSPQTYSHTTTGSNRILFVSIFTQGSVTGVTYGGVSMTQLGTTSYSSPTGVCYLFMLVNPTLGANNVVVTHSGSYTASVAASYTGAKQTDQPDTTVATNTTGAGSATTLATTVTTGSDNAWVVTATATEAGLGVTAGSGAYLRQTGSNPAVALLDSNSAITPAGSHTTNVNAAVSTQICMVTSAFAPAVAATSNSNFLMFM